MKDPFPHRNTEERRLIFLTEKKLDFVRQEKGGKKPKDLIVSSISLKRRIRKKKEEG